MAYKQITFEIIDQVARIGFGKYSNKPLTTLELETMDELETVLGEIKKRQLNDIIGMILFSHKKHVFLAGMNVKVIRDLKSVQDGVKGCRHGQKVCCEIEDLLIPTIACVDGVCFGGGLELALACKTIVVSDSPYTILGAPEVTLGLLPAFGGSYRLPRRIELSRALDLMLSGRVVKGKTAKEMGLVDQIYAKEKLVEMAISDYIQGSERERPSEGSTKGPIMKNPSAQKAIFNKTRESVLKETKGHYEAPLRILDLLESSLNDPREIYLEKEAQLLGELAVSEQSRNLQNIYFLQARSQRYKGPSGDKERMIPKRGAVVGAGMMGGGIAWLMAKHNMSPIMKDTDSKGLESGLKQTESIFSEAVNKKKISKDDARRKQKSIKPQLDYNGFKHLDLVVESVVEEFDVKKNVFAEIEKEVSDDCLITTNTSSLSVNELATVFSRPERFAGLHFFYPDNRMQLVEIITHTQIASETIAALYQWSLNVKKVPVVVKDGPGFLINRLLAPFFNEAFFLLEEGVPIDMLEEVVLDFGMPAGPCSLLDEVGIDVGYKVINSLHKAAGDRFKPAAIYKKVSELNCHGTRSQRGFFCYDDQGRKLEINKEILTFFPEKKIKMKGKEIQKRFFLPMINEAAFVLQEQIVGTVEEIDLSLVFGVGFPRFRGGLLKYADSLGSGNILQALDQFAKDYCAKRFDASSLIKDMAKKNETFYH